MYYIFSMYTIYSMSFNFNFNLFSFIKNLVVIYYTCLGYLVQYIEIISMIF